MAMARETKANKDFSPRTIDTARWAREQIKRQIGTSYTSYTTSMPRLRNRSSSVAARLLMR